MVHDYHFVIKKLAEEFNGEFECLGENIEKYITFLVPLKKKMIMIMIKRSHINKSLLIATDLCQLQYQIFLITCLEFVIKNVKNVWKEKTLG